MKTEPENDLFKILGEETEAKTEQETQESFEPKNIDQNNFSPEPEPAFSPSPEPEPEQEPILSFEEQAKLYIAFIDNTGQLFLPAMYRKKIFPGELLGKMEAIKAKVEATKNPDISPDEAPILKRLELYRNLVEGVPFTDSEIELLQPPLGAFLKKHKMTSGPEILLMIAAGQVIVPRLMPLFMKFD